MVELSLESWGTIGSLAAMAVTGGLFIGKLHQKVSNQEQTIQEMKKDIQAKPSMEKFSRIEGTVVVIATHIAEIVGDSKAVHIAVEILDRLHRRSGVNE